MAGEMNPSRVSMCIANERRLIAHGVYGRIRKWRRRRQRDFANSTFAFLILTAWLTSVCAPGATPFSQRGAGKKESTVLSSDGEFVLAQLAHCERAGMLEGVEIEYWTGGGQPPPYYRSDQFRLLTSDGRDVMQFVTIKSDERYDPPNLQEKSSLPARNSDIQNVARLLRETRVFVKRYPEEEKPGIADVLSTEVIVSAAGRSEKRSYYRRLPEELAPLKAQIEALIEVTRSQGKKELYHQGKAVPPAHADRDMGNKQVLADTFRNLVRYALLTTRRDVAKFGVTPGSFSVEAMDASLAARANAGIFGQQVPPSLKALLKEAHEPSLTFHFYWMAPTTREQLVAAFGLSYEPDGDLEVRLLWLGLPERIPISRRVGVINGLKPLEEAVAELLRVPEVGRLAPYPPPE